MTPIEFEQDGVRVTVLDDPAEVHDCVILVDGQETGTLNHYRGHGWIATATHPIQQSNRRVGTTLYPKPEQAARAVIAGLVKDGGPLVKPKGA